MSSENKQNEENVLVLDLQTMLLPASVIIGAVIIAATIYFTGGGNNVSGTNVSGSDQNTEDSDPLLAFASDLGVDTKDLQECIDSGDMEDEIQNDISEASAAGINGTPGFIVGKIQNGKVVGEIISGAQPFASFQTVIDKYISGDGLDSTSIDLGDDPVLGDVKAKVAIVEFSDFECPYCQSFHTSTYPQIVSEYVDSGDVLYVYKDFPLSFHDPVATDEAVAAECVQELAGDEAFYSYASLIYENTKSNGEGL